jgi:hypothetical protein
VEHLHASSGALGRHELELPLADLGDLGALFSQPQSYPPVIATELAASRAAVLQDES